MNKLKLIALGLIFGSTANAAALDVEKSIANKLNSITGFDVKSVRDHTAGLIEIITNKGIFYSTRDGEHLISGQVYKFEEGLHNTTAEAKRKIAKKDISGLKDSFVTYKAPNEKHQVLVFFDTSCGYCRKMHSQMSQYNARGITVHYALWPRDGVYIPNTRNSVHSQGYLNMESISCAPKPNMAMDMVMRDSAIPQSTCDSRIEESFELGRWLGVQGTPAIFNLDGDQVSRGYLPPAALAKKLEEDA